MATRSVGIDLGAYSVKVAIANAGFRHSAVVDFIERPVPPGPESEQLKRAAATAAEILREHLTENDSIYLCVPGDMIHARVLEFGFKGLRRSDLEKAVGGELEALLPFDLEDIVFDFETLPRDLGELGPSEVEVEDATEGADPSASQSMSRSRSGTMKRVTGVIAAWSGGGSKVGTHPGVDDDPTFVQGAQSIRPPRGRVAPPAHGMRVFACAMQQSRARQLLAAVEDWGEEPRGLLVMPAVYSRLVERIPALASAAGQGEPVAVIDMGHSRTDVCVIKGGRVIFARTMTRGGRDVTAAIANAWKISPEEAARAKHTDGFIGSTFEPPPSDAWRRIHDVVSVELEPLGRELRQTLAACRAETGGTATVGALIGGAARLRGMASFLRERAKIDTTTLDEEACQALVGQALAESGTPVDIACAALGAAFEGASGRPVFDLRQAELAYKADFSFLRAKAAQLATAVLLVIAFAAASAFADLHRLRTDEANLVERLRLETTAEFGAKGETMEAWEVLNMSTGKKKEKSPLPKMTAYDVLLVINENLPTKEEIALDVNQLTIRPGNVDLSATVAAAEEIDKIVERLDQIECIETISRGDQSTASDGRTNFSLSMNETTCIWGKSRGL